MKGRCFGKIKFSGNSMFFRYTIFEDCYFDGAAEFKDCVFINCVFEDMHTYRATILKRIKRYIDMFFVSRKLYFKAESFLICNTVIVSEGTEALIEVDYLIGGKN